jgi:hypothetical protein
MTHISSIGAGIFTDLSFCSTAQTALPAAPGVITDWAAKFVTEIAFGAAPAATSFYRIKNVREFPAVGTPANIVNVPVYGQKTSSQIQGQSDAPSLEVTINWTGLDFQEATNYLGAIVGNGSQYYFRLAILNVDPGAGKYASATTGLGTVVNSQYFWLGKLEAFTVSPQLTDANQATLTLSAQSDFYGAFTNDPA